MRIGRQDARRPRSLARRSTRTAALAAAHPASLEGSAMGASSRRHRDARRRHGARRRAPAADPRGRGRPLPGQGGPRPAERFSTLAMEKLGPRCATASCHAGVFRRGVPALDADVAYGALVGEPSQQAR